jgi:formylglycine-generating enzyme required for sulfatase activity
MTTGTIAIPRKMLVCILAAAVCFLSGAESKSDDPDNAAPATADPMLGKKAGQMRDDNRLTMKLVWCPPGFVTMEQVERAAEPSTRDDEADEDNTKDKPARPTIEKITPVKVLVTRGYWLGQFEVTQSEWKQIMATEPWKGDRWVKEGDDYPAADISWDDAVDFCRKMTEQERRAGRLSNDWEYTLPTEAQWERACRARTETRFSFGDDESKLGEYAWLEDNAGNAGEPYAHRVGQKKANPWGVYDMHGNVREWCRDCYAERLPGGRDPDAQADAKGAGPFRVFRGGSWADSAAFCRSAERFRDSPSDRSNVLGFRIALSAVR